MSGRAEPGAEHVAQLLRQASALRQAGRVAEAITAYERLLQLQPALPDSWYNLGWLRRRAGQHQAALDAYAQALQHGVSGPEEVHLNRAVILSDHLARADDAAAELQRALQLNPRYVPAWLNLGNLHEDRGRRDDAAGAYRQVLALEPSHALALARLAGVSTLRDAADPLIAQLRQALSRPGLDAAERADLGFGLGKALDDVGAWDAAFAAYSAANQASRGAAGAAGVRYDAAAHAALVDALIAAFPAAVPQPAPVAMDGAGGDRPAAPSLFICGMFRSGSTLVEQILAAHPQVCAGGELDLLPALIRQHLPQPGRPGFDAARNDAPRLAALYRDVLAALHPQAVAQQKLITDKRPDNFLWIGLIKTLFPAARIVHTRRDARDNGLSIFFLHLGHAMPYALDLADIAHWHRQYSRLMAHWKRLYGGDILDVDYDALVATPRPVIAPLLAFAGLPWDEACMAFHTTPGVVKTASVWQVRQPLYQRSSGRWRHYQRHIGPLLQGLAQTDDGAASAPAAATSAPDGSRRRGG